MPTPRGNSTRWEFYHDEVSAGHAWMSTKCPPCRQRGAESTAEAGTAVPLCTPPTICASVGSCVSTLAAPPAAVAVCVRPWSNALQAELEALVVELQQAVDRRVLMHVVYVLMQAAASEL